MQGLSDTDRVVADEQALSTTLDGESVVLHTGSGTYFGFNEVGTDIWECIQSPSSVSTIADRISDEYDVSRAECRGDVESLLSELLENGLAEVVDEQGE
ncbi:PqqD family peptide modification chaperone [Halapricum sp. CBA1109]|uniref:PqqD family protein n=1 Tax=Halapricum sp. CBA1109 TaxID=2668068 RepID=UPI0012F7AF05|nr:PqqD family protein [Halapricum sp. CBA1109]MUV88613.1 PqqD family peptide modification chaperone [Halapricum sp. CBA1109]